MSAPAAGDRERRWKLAAAIYFVCMGVFLLCAAPETLEARCLRQPERVRPLDYTLAKLRQIEALPHPKIDTTRLAPEEVAARIVALVQQSAA